MISFKVPSAEIEKRNNNIQKEMQDQGIDGLFIVQRVDLFYFSGTAQNGFLFIPAAGEPLLFIKHFMPRAVKETTVKNMIQINSIKEIPGLIIDYYGNLPDVLGFEFDVLPVKDFNFYKTLFTSCKPVDGSPLILNVRKIKSDWEIIQLDNTAEMTRKTFEYMQTAIRPGLTEMEFAGIFETFARKLGHGGKLRARDYQAEAYPWHVLSGKNGGKVGVLDSPSSGEGTSAAFPSGAGNKVICKNEPVMIDLGSILNGYHMDETRMFAINSMPSHAMEACRAVIEIHDVILEKAKPGVTVGELFDHSVELAKKMGYKKTFLGPPEFKVTFIGHGIGLELIEPPVIAKGREDILEPGMTFALEPKMNFINEFAAGIESVFLVTQTGTRLISKVPVKIFIC